MNVSLPNLGELVDATGRILGLATYFPLLNLGIIVIFYLIYLGIIDNNIIFAPELDLLIMIFKRKLYSDMLQWKQDSNGASALLIKGARRVGKSTLAKEFAKNE